MKTRFTEGLRHWHPYGHGSCAQAHPSEASTSGVLSLATSGAALTSAPMQTTAIAAAATNAKPTRPAMSLHMDICCFPQR
jgi:hypothetical protein